MGHAEKGFRIIKCVGTRSNGQQCISTIRFSISAEDYGKTLVIGCPDCHHKMRVNIPVPAPVTNPPTPSSIFNDLDEFERLSKLLRNFK
jgi:hypothetical protein